MSDLFKIAGGYVYDPINSWQWAIGLEWYLLCLLYTSDAADE